MPESKPEIIFLNRAYNDLDIQLPLIDKIAQDGSFHVRVIGYPCDGDMGSPRLHEAVPYLKDRYDISFETVLDSAPAPVVMRVAYRLEQFLFALKRKKLNQFKPAQLALKVLHVGVLTYMRHHFRGDIRWLDQMCATWKAQAIIMDEACVQKNRSYMIDHILPQKVEQGAKLYAIQTGQMVYLDVAPNKSATALEQLNRVRRESRSLTHRFIVPSALDQEAVNYNFPLESPEVHGNLRMDMNWIRKLHRDILVPPYSAKKDLFDQRPEGSLRVVFMLSKLSYGVELEEIRKTIAAVCNIEGISCAIKPHTRGMKFDFMTESEISGAAIVYSVPSAELIEWADMVLFTGSGIAFHALAVGKRVGFLKNCQNLETVFDNGNACDLFNSSEEIVEFLKEWQKSGEPDLSDAIKNERRQWQAKHLYADVEDGKTVDHYYKMITSDLMS